MEEYAAKRGRLIHHVTQYAEQDVAVAFSGGVDSCLLLWRRIRPAGRFMR